MKKEMLQSRSWSQAALQIFVGIGICWTLYASTYAVTVVAQHVNDPELLRVRDKLEGLQEQQSRLALEITPRLAALEAKINAVLWAMSGLTGMALTLGGKALYDSLGARRRSKLDSANGEN